MEERGNPNVIVIGEYINDYTPIEYQCKINSKHKWTVIPKDLLQGYGCPFCRGMQVNETNSVRTLRPDLLKYLKYESDADKYTPNSHKKVTVKCPDCGTEKEIMIDNLSRQGFSCLVCSDGISFPNKIIRNMLIMLGINFIPEWSPDWIRPFRYDVMFEKDGQKYICEMDGKQHKTKIFNGEKSSLNDEEKDKKAIDNGIIIIRIDCEESNYDFIINNIKNSIIGDMFDLDNFNWNDCIVRSEKSLLIQICEEVNKNPDVSIKELKEKFKIHRDTVRRYINKGIKLNLIKKRVERAIKVNVYKNKTLILTCKSISSLAEILESNYNIKISRKVISIKLKEGNGKFSFEEYDFIIKWAEDDKD